MILDASALLALLRLEPGEEIVAAAVAGGAHVSTVNYSEVLARLSDRGESDASSRLVRSGLVGQAIRLEAFTAPDAIESARLRPLTRHVGLSLADRSCLATAGRLGLPALTADRAWSDVDVGVEVRQIR